MGTSSTHCDYPPGSISGNGYSLARGRLSNSGIRRKEDYTVISTCLIVMIHRLPDFCGLLWFHVYFFAFPVLRIKGAWYINIPNTSEARLVGQTCKFIWGFVWLAVGLSARQASSLLKQALQDRSTNRVSCRLYQNGVLEVDWIWIKASGHFWIEFKHA